MPATLSVLSAAAKARDVGDWASARTLFAQALAQSPNSAELTLELAICALRTHDTHEALRLTKQVSDLKYLGRAAIIRGKTYQVAHDLDSAAEAYETGIRDGFTPRRVQQRAASILAELTLNQFGDPVGAAALLTELTSTDPEKRSEAQLIADMYSGKRRGRSLAVAFTKHAQRYIDAGTRPFRARKSTKKAKRRTSIGIVSPSFFATPVGFLTLGTLQALSKSADLVFFDRRPRDDWLSREFRRVTNRWHDVSALDSHALAKTFNDFGLDTLIDCGGWTDLPALTALSMRPCARQFKWVGGQAMTTGLRCFDGFLADTRQVPKSCEAMYVEPIKRFTTSYVTYVSPPYFDYLAGQKIAKKTKPKARERAYALVSNPAKISEETLNFVKSLRPKTLWLIDSRWKHKRTKKRFLPLLEDIADRIEYVTPKSHREYLETLRDLPANFVDTRPYTMGLTAIELLLLGKPIVGPRRRSGSLMYERHSLGHQGAARFDHYEAHAAQLLKWCRS